MKIFKNYLFLLFAMTMILASCSKDNIDEQILEVEEPEVTVVDSNPLLGNSSVVSEGLLMDCFTIHYPFEVVDQDGNLSTITNEEDWNALMEDEDNFYVDFVYPITITYEDGETQVIDSHEALCDAFIACIPDGGWTEEDFPAYLINEDNSCYEFVYPLTLVDLDGNLTEVNDEDELAAALVDSYQSFVFPFTLLHEDGEEVEINNTDELFTALFSCSGWEPVDSIDINWETGFEYIGCYTVSFPLNVINGEGDIVTVNDHMELCDLMFTGDFAGYSFPMTLIDEEGNTIVVENQEDLDAALLDCPEIEWPGEGLDILFDFWASELFEDCYTVVYPLNLNLQDGSVLVVNSSEELDLAMQNTDIIIIGMELPVTIVLANGDTFVVNSFEDYLIIISGC